LAAHRRLLLLLVCWLVAGTGFGVVAASAGNYEQYYVVNVLWGPGQSRHSAFNGLYDYNAVVFGHPDGGLPQMGTRYERSDGTSGYSYMWSNTGALRDYRVGYSYGAARCKANDGNGYNVYISYCYTRNF
jgi:hypothetical protein